MMVSLDVHCSYYRFTDSVNVVSASPPSPTHVTTFILLPKCKMIWHHDKSPLKALRHPLSSKESTGQRVGYKTVLHYDRAPLTINTRAETDGPSTVASRKMALKSVFLSDFPAVFLVIISYHFLLLLISFVAGRD